MVKNTPSSCALAIFAKTPSLSPVKTRLAATIGVEQATSIYEASINCLQQTLTLLPSCITPIFSLAEQEGPIHPYWSGYKTMHSGEGSLGYRLHHTYNTLIQQYDYVILIGSDSPQLSPSIFKEATEKINTYDHVIGPSYDGGFYLFAGKASISKEVWITPLYSKENTFNHLVKEIKGSIHYLKKEHDLDTEKDIKPISIIMRESPFLHHNIFGEYLTNSYPSQLQPPSTQN